MELSGLGFNREEVTLTKNTRENIIPLENNGSETPNSLGLSGSNSLIILLAKGIEKGRGGGEGRDSRGSLGNYSK